MNGSVTTAAHGQVMFCRFLAAQREMRIVAGGAGHLALQKTGGLPQPISLMCDFEPVVKFGAGLAIENEFIVL
jgi:hypothetical protein